MRKIIIALLGLTATLVMGDVGTCEKNCGIDYGKCMILRGDIVGCLQEEGACALECLKTLVVASERHHHHHSTP